MQLIETGDLALEARLDSVFPNLRDQPAGRVTIAQLLTHTSGINELISQHKQRRITPSDLETAEVEPNGSFAYSNTGYVCLALVVESVTGQPFASVLHERILAPAGMHDSGVLRSGAAIARLAVGFQEQDDQKL